MFKMTKVYNILQFDYNLDPKGWIYDTEKFKVYMQNVLFNIDYIIPYAKVNEFEIESKSVSSYFGPNTSEFQALTKIYGRSSSDIKSYIGSRNYNATDFIIRLLKKNRSRYSHSHYTISGRIH